MKKLRFAAAAAFAAVVLIGGTVSRAQAPREPAPREPVPYQGQNRGQFQMFFSSIARADNYLVDTVNGKVWEGGVTSDGDKVFGRLAITPEPKAGATTFAGRYVIYFSPQVRSDCYLVDTLTGRTWAQYQDIKTKEFFFREILVAGVTPAAGHP